MSFTGGFEVNLDKRKLKTPLGNLMKLSNEALAVAVATEWDMQGPILQQHNMHIVSKYRKFTCFKSDWML